MRRTANSFSPCLLCIHQVTNYNIIDVNRCYILLTFQGPDQFNLLPLSFLKIFLQMWNVANSFVTQWHYLVTLMKRNNVRILPLLLIITIKLSKKKKKCRISYEIDHNLQYAVFISGIIQTTPVFATSKINLLQPLEPLESRVAKQIAFILHFEKLPSSFPNFYK